MGHVPSAPIFVLEKQDGFVHVARTVEEALAHEAGEEVDDHEPIPDAETLDFFDAAGRKLQRVQGQLTVDESDPGDYRPEVRRRVATMLAQIKARALEEARRADQDYAHAARFDIAEGERDFTAFAEQAADLFDPATEPPAPPQPPDDISPARRGSPWHNFKHRVGRAH